MKKTILIFVMLSFFVLDSNAQKRKYYPPFMEELNVKLQKFWDEDDWIYCISGDNPAYYYIPELKRELYYAGKMDEEDHSLIYGDLRVFDDTGWREEIGFFRNAEFIGGMRFFRDYDYPQFDRSVELLASDCHDIYYAKSDTEFYKILSETRNHFFSGVLPNSIKPLRNQLSPRYVTSKFKGWDKGAASFTTPNYPKPGQIVTINQNTGGKKLSKVGKVVALATLAAAVGIALKAFTVDDNSSSSSSYSSSSSQAATPTDIYEYKNVEIVNWATYNWLAAAHAEVELRNKNNYDVIVNVSLYQGSWSEGRIIYSDLTKGDRIPGVSDEYSSDIRVKANSIRRVCLRADHSGRPTHIRISSVR